MEVKIDIIFDKIIVYLVYWGSRYSFFLSFFCPGFLNLFGSHLILYLSFYY